MNIPRLGEELLLGLQVVPALPNARHPATEGAAVFERLTGATIVRIGTTDERHSELEGGGLIVDFVAQGETQIERVVFAFNENGMWVVQSGISLMPGNLSLRLPEANPPSPGSTYEEAEITPSPRFAFGMSNG